jgi:hypothetical protein
MTATALDRGAIIIGLRDLVAELRDPCRDRNDPDTSLRLRRRSQAAMRE